MMVRFKATKFFKRKEFQANPFFPPKLKRLIGLWKMAFSVLLFLLVSPGVKSSLRNICLLWINDTLMFHNVHIHNEPCYSKCGPRTSSTRSPEELVRNGDSQDPHRSTELELTFYQHLRWLLCTLQFENYC